MNITVKSIALCALTSCGVPAHADSLVLHGVSYHPEFLGEMNGKNWGLGYRIEDYLGVDNLDYQFGGYLNSYENLSLYNIFDYTTDSGLGVFVGLASGYCCEATTISEDIGTVVLGAVRQQDYGTLRVTPTWNGDNQWGVVAAYSLNLGD